MKKIFLSLPMSGRTDDEIRNDISKMKEIAIEKFGDDIICLHNQDMEPSESQLKDAVTKNLLYLGSAIMTMATCDAVVFRYDWAKARGCRSERYIAEEYLIPCYYINVDGKMAEVA